jgi:hypothetical protein
VEITHFIGGPCQHDELLLALIGDMTRLSFHILTFFFFAKHLSVRSKYVKGSKDMSWTAQDVLHCAWWWRMWMDSSMPALVQLTFQSMAWSAVSALPVTATRYLNLTYDT